MPARNRDRNPPSIEAWRTLLVFEKAGGVTEAARRLNVSQPVVSRKLAVFETADACGAPLLKRNERGLLELNDAADGVLPAVRQMVRQHDQILDYIASLRSAPELVRIGTGSFAAQHYLPLALAKLRDRLEDFEVEVHVARGAERIVGVADGRFDLATVTHDPALIREVLKENGRPADAIQVVSLGRQPMAVIARKGTPEGAELQSTAKDGVVPLECLKRWSLVGLDERSGVRRQLERCFAGRHSLEFIAEGGGWSAAREYVRNGLGVAVVPLVILTPDDDNTFVIRRLSDRLSLSIYLIHRPTDLTPAERALKAALKSVIQTRQEESEARWRPTRTM